MPENKKPCKTRVAIASQIKLDILNDLDNKVSTIAEVFRKYGVHHNAVGGWKNQWEKIRREVEEEGHANKKCVLQDDGLMRIRLDIEAFYELNETLPKSLKLPIMGE
jgi:transposase-like protein